MYNFCTLFDRNYFYKGLAMYHSLVANCSEDFNLWILCMDRTTYELLEKMNLPKIKLVSLEEFESPELLKVKKERSVAEYSWTCASNFVWFLLQKYPSCDTMIYLDADIYFFNDPKILIDELGNKDVMITEHRYTKKYDQSAVSGKYCVQFMVFKNTPNGLNILNWWRKACLDWCFGYLDKGRLGDQKYLDDWVIRFKSVHELQHLGGGVAPWNMQQYDFFIKNNKVFGCAKGKNDDWPLIFYHFHGFYLMSSDKYLPAPSYDISRNAKKFICASYFKALQKNIEFVKGFSSNFNFGYRPLTIKERVVFWLGCFSFVRLASRIIRKILSN